MFVAPRDLRSRKHSESHTTDDHSSTKDIVRKGLPPSSAPQRYVRELCLSSHSLATTSSQYDDQPGATSARTPSSHAHSTQSTPMTSPSTGYGSLFPGSISSATSESLPSADTKYRSEFGLLTPGPSSAHSPIHGSASSRASHPVSPRSRSTTESDIHSSAPRPPRKYPATQSSHRPSTAPQSPSALTTTTTKGSESPAEIHHRSQSRLTIGIKSLLSKSTLPSPSRFSFHSAATTPSDSIDHAPRERTSKWPITPKKPRPPNIDISSDGGTPLPSPSPSTHPTDVHRRYVSETAKADSPRTGTTAPTRSQDSLDTCPPPPPAKEPKHRNVLRRRPSAAKLPKEGQRATSTSSQAECGGERSSKDGEAEMPPALTPAGAVVEAYKQQELSREDASSPFKASIDETLFMSPKASTDSGYAEDDHAQRSPTPYYTVFGTSSGRLVRAGGPEDRWSRFEGQMVDQQRTWVGTSTPPQPETGGRSLTRKVSSRWKKVKGGGGGVTTERSPTRGEMGHSKGRPSFQEVWSSAKLGDRDGRMMGRSMDGLPNDVWTSPLGGHARSGSEKGEGGEGGKLWKLVKRLSTGGLRDRYHSDKFVPPVPAIPKELLEKVNHGDRSEHSLDHSPQHPSTPHTLPRHRKSASSHEKDHPSTIPKHVPNLTTASSSPNSSDVACAHFFHKTRSARSSVSSYGELAIPPVPEIALDRHIITPLEQLRLGGDVHVDSESLGSAPQSPRRSTSVPAVARSTDPSNADELPLPSPRRQTCVGDSPSRSPSTTPSLNSHSSKQKSESFLADGSIALSPPPPRPSRNMRRMVGSLGTPPQPQPQPRHRALSGVAGMSQTDLNLASSAQQSHPTVQPVRTQLTFRELHATRKPPLSEREKADIWDDLLARSDQAGGTLHLGAGADELMSDRIRFSTYSELASS